MVGIIYGARYMRAFFFRPPSRGVSGLPGAPFFMPAADFPLRHCRLALLARSRTSKYAPSLRCSPPPLRGPQRQAATSGKSCVSFLTFHTQMDQPTGTGGRRVPRGTRSLLNIYIAGTNRDEDEVHGKEAVRGCAGQHQDRISRKHRQRPPIRGRRKINCDLRSNRHREGLVSVGHTQAQAACT